MSQRHTLDDLVTLMARLRDPESGCPWDLKQDFHSIVPHTIEEAYEVADAIEREDFAHLPDELGDLLFQVIFYSRLGQEQGRFSLDDVIHGVVEKLLRRHPHVFPDGSLNSRRAPGESANDDQIKANWESIKQHERAGRGEDVDSLLDGIASGLPAFIRAEKLQKRAHRHGFDWPDIEPVFDKLQEEIEEVREAWDKHQATGNNRDHVESEMGDLLFVCVNLSRFLDVNPEQALQKANRKFERRFRMMESILRESENAFPERDLAGLEALWQAAKKKTGG